MDTPPLWLLLVSASFFGFLTKSKAEKYGKRRIFWFWMGFVFGIWGLISFYLSKHFTRNATIKKIQSELPPYFLLTPGSWYWGENGKAMGPVSHELIQKMYDEGKIQLDTLIWHESLENWVRLEEFKA